MGSPKALMITMQWPVDIVTEFIPLVALETVRGEFKKKKRFGSYETYGFQNQDSKSCLDLILMDPKPYGKL